MARLLLEESRSIFHMYLFALSVVASLVPGAGKASTFLSDWVEGFVGPGCKTIVDAGLFCWRRWQPRRWSSWRCGRQRRRWKHSGLRRWRAPVAGPLSISIRCFGRRHTRPCPVPLSIDGMTWVIVLSGCVLWTTEELPCEAKIWIAVYSNVCSSASRRDRGGEKIGF